MPPAPRSKRSISTLPCSARCARPDSWHGWIELTRGIGRGPQRAAAIGTDGAERCICHLSEPCVIHPKKHLYWSSAQGQRCSYYAPESWDFSALCRRPGQVRRDCNPNTNTLRRERSTAISTFGGARCSVLPPSRAATPSGCSSAASPRIPPRQGRSSIREISSPGSTECRSARRASSRSLSPITRSVQRSGYKSGEMGLKGSFRCLCRPLVLEGTAARPLPSVNRFTPLDFGRAISR